MMRAALLGIALLLVAVAAEARAAEGWPLSFEVRAHLGVTPGVDMVDRGVADGEYDNGIGLSYGAQGLIRYRLSSRFGWVFETGFFANEHGGELSADTNVVSAYAGTGIECGLGAYWLLNPQVHIELMPMFQAGKGRLTIDNDGDETLGEFGSYSAWNVQTGCYYTFPFGLQLGGVIGWMQWQGKSSVLDVSTRSEGAGIVSHLVVGYSF